MLLQESQGRSPHFFNTQCRISNKIVAREYERNIRPISQCYADWCHAPTLEYCAPVWMSTEVSHLSLLDRVVCCAERMYEVEHCCLGHRKKINAICLLYYIYHRADHPLHEYLHHFVAALNTRPSAALCELALVIPWCRTDQFSRSFLPVAMRL